MRLRNFAVLVLLFVVFGAVGFGQVEPSPTPTPDAEAEKAKKEIQERVSQMLEQAVGDANSLRLPQNRAIVYAITGDLYWKRDEKRARELFRNMAAEIVSANAETEKEQADANANNRNNFVPPDPSGDLRAQLLPMVAVHDAELAYQMLLQTRPAKLAEAMAKAAGGATTTNNRPGGAGGRGAGGGGGPGGFDPASQQVAGEVALEQQFALLAAENDPDAAVKLIKDSMSKGISSNVLPLLQNLYKKDDKKAGELAGDVVGKIVSDDMTKNVQDLNVALNFLQFSTRPLPATTNPADKAFAFTDTQVKDLANKIVNTLTSMTPSAQTANLINRAMPTLQKVAPDKIGLLTQKLADSQKTIPANRRGQQQQQRVFDRTASPEDILAQVPALTNDADKRAAYQSVANKAAQISTDDARAQKLIDQIGDDTIRATAQQQFGVAQANRAASAGKLDDARRMINSITDKRTRIQRLVALALVFQKKATEKDLENARSIMKDAKGLINEIPEDEDDLADLMEVVKGYAVIDPETAFRLAEPSMETLNDMVQATALLSKFNKRDRTFKKGELVMRMNGSGGGFGGGTNLLLFKYVPQMQLLGKADLIHMSLVADRFARSDTRTIVRLFVLQGFLAEDKKPAAPPSQPAAGNGRPGN